jgi:aspartokinase
VSNVPFDLTVCKIGGSVLTGLDAYHAATRALGIPDPGSRQRLVVVVSAENGQPTRCSVEATTLAPSRMRQCSICSGPPANSDRWRS